MVVSSRFRDVLVIDCCLNLKDLIILVGYSKHGRAKSVQRVVMLLSRKRVAHELDPLQTSQGL